MGLMGGQHHRPLTCIYASIGSSSLFSSANKQQKARKMLTTVNEKGKSESTQLSCEYAQSAVGESETVLKIQRVKLKFSVRDAIKFMANNQKGRLNRWFLRDFRKYVKGSTRATLIQILSSTFVVNNCRIKSKYFTVFIAVILT